MYWPSMAEVAEVMPWFWPVVAAGFGGIAGSFANCMAYRVPRRLPLSRPPSQCPACNTLLTVPDLVPVVSYIVLAGKCRHCKTPIPLRSLLVEAVCVGVALVVYGVVGPQAMLWPVLAGTLLLAVGATVLAGWRTTWPQSHSPRRKPR